MADYGSTDSPYVGTLRLPHKCNCHAYVLKFVDKRMNLWIDCEFNEFGGDLITMELELKNE
jgi:hypothetical protein